jgi:hypothetical protein
MERKARKPLSLARNFKVAVAQKVLGRATLAISAKSTCRFIG